MDEKYTRPALISPPKFEDDKAISVPYYNSFISPICTKCGEGLKLSAIHDSVLIEPCIKCAMGDICE